MRNQSADRRRSRRRSVVAIAAALSAALCAHIPTSADIVTAQWVSPVNGNWTDASKWSTAPDYPYNDLHPGTDFDAVIAVTSGAPYTVTLNQTTNVGSILLDSPDATLTVAGIDTWLSASRGIDLRAGALSVTTGRIFNTTIQGPGQFTVHSGVLDNIRLATPLTVTGTPTLSGGMVIDDQTLSLASNASLNFSSPGTQTLSGTGRIVTLPGTGLATLNATDGYLILGPGITVEASGRNIQLGTPGNGFVTNQGTLFANNRTLTLSGGWENQGTLKVAGTGALILNGNYATSSLSRLERSGGTVTLNGTLDNSNATLSLDDATGSFIVSANLFGGTIRTSGPNHVIVPTSSTPRWSSMTLAGVAEVRDFADVRFVGLNLDGGEIQLGKNAGLSFSLTHEMTGQGTIFFDGDNAFLRPESSSSGELTIGPGVALTTRNGRGVIGNAAWTATAIVNKGTLRAQGPMTPTAGQLELRGTFTNQGTLAAAAGALLVIDATRFQNTGVIDLDDSSTLLYAGAIDPAAVGTIRRTGGTVRIAGQVNNDGKTLHLDAFGPGTLLFGDPASPYSTLGPAVIRGGVIAPRVGATPLTISTRATLASGVVMNADLHNPNATLRIENGLTLNGTARLGETGLLSFDAGTLSGSGVVLMDKGGTIANANSTAPLILGPDITVRSISGPTSSNQANITGRITNQGLVAASGPSARITVGGSHFRNEGVIEAADGGEVIAVASSDTAAPFTNAGTLRAVSGGILTLYPAADRFVSPGTISVTDSALQLEGDFSADSVPAFTRTRSTVTVFGNLDNSGKAISTDAFAGPWRIGTGGKLIGGILTASPDDAPLPVIPDRRWTTVTEATLDGVTLDADVAVQPNATLRLTGPWRNNRTISALDATVILAGTPSSVGTLSATNTRFDVAGTLTTDQLRAVPTGNNNRLSIASGGNVLNTGQTLLIDDATGPLHLAGGKITGGIVRAAGAAGIVAGPGNSTSTLADVTVDSPITVDSSVLAIEGTFEHSGKPVRLAGSASLHFRSAATIAAGEILFDNPLGPSPSIQFGAGGLTLGPDAVLRSGPGGGSVISSTTGAALTNRGLISSATDRRAISFFRTRLDNQGRIEATNGGVIDLSLSTLANVSNGVFSGGTWFVGPNSTLRMPFNPGPLSLNADLTLSGPNSFIIAACTRNDGRFSLLDDRDYDVLHLDWTNAGTLTLGVGSTLKTHDTFTLADTSDLILQLAGLDPDLDYGSTSAKGAISLDGDLTIQLAPGYTPSPGSTFELMTATSITGEFDTLTLPDLPNDWTFSLAYTPTAVTLTVVPEPAAGFLLPLILLRRRTRSRAS